jgi:hypothetical protein
VNIAYVGTRGSRLSTYYPYNMNQFVTGAQNFPKMGSINYNNYNGISNYDGLQLHAEHRAPTGWSPPSPMPGRTRWMTREELSRVGPRNSITIRWRAMETPARTSARSSAHHPLSIALRPWPALWRQCLTSHGMGGWRLAEQPDRSGSVRHAGRSLHGRQLRPNRPDLTGSIKYPKSISGYWFDPASFSNPPTTRAHPQRHDVYAPGNPRPQPGLRAGIPRGQLERSEEHPSDG